MFRHGPSCLSGPVSRDRDWPAGDKEAAEMSTAAHHPDSQAKERPIRTELVERVRREIADGTYDTPEKWDIALERLFQRLEGNDS